MICITFYVFSTFFFGNFPPQIKKQNEKNIHEGAYLVFQNVFYEKFNTHNTDSSKH